MYVEINNKGMYNILDIPPELFNSIIACLPCALREESEKQAKLTRQLITQMNEEQNYAVHRPGKDLSSN